MTTDILLDDDSVTIQGNGSVTIQGNDSVTIQGNDSVTIQGRVTFPGVVEINGAASFTNGALFLGKEIGIGTSAPKRIIHVTNLEGTSLFPSSTSTEIHSGGNSGGFSFSDRSHRRDNIFSVNEDNFENSPAKGERWVWYADKGAAHLWSGNDKVTINYNGDVTINGRLNVKEVPETQVFSLKGTTYPVTERLVIALKTEDVALLNPALQYHPGMQNHIAISHIAPGDILNINRDSAYKGGVRIDGNVDIQGKLSVNGDNANFKKVSGNSLSLHTHNDDFVPVIPIPTQPPVIVGSRSVDKSELIENATITLTTSNAQFENLPNPHPGTIPVLKKTETSSVSITDSTIIFKLEVKDVAANHIETATSFDLIKEFNNLKDRVAALERRLGIA